MRTTPSRFNSFVVSVDPNVEGRPVPQAKPQVKPQAAPTALVGPTQLSVLEQRHPAVIQTLRLLWGYPELNQYFEKVYSGRDASLNLEPAAMAELMVLAGVHQRICSHRPSTPVEELYGTGRWADPWKPVRSRR